MPERLEKEYKLIKVGLVYCEVRRLYFKNNEWVQDKTQTRQKDIIGGMFKIDPKIRMDSTRIWGSLAWYKTMEIKYPQYIIIQGDLYYTRIHPGRITEIKLKLDRLMKANKVKEEEFIHLNYPQLIEFIKRFE
jgi:hypothetical protein